MCGGARRGAELGVSCRGNEMREIIADLGPISLGRFVPSDFDDVHAFASDPVVRRFQAWGTNTPQDTRAFLDDALIISEMTHHRCTDRGRWLSCLRREPA